MSTPISQLDASGPSTASEGQGTVSDEMVVQRPSVTYELQPPGWKDRRAREAPLHKLKMFEYMTQEEFALNTAYRHALRPIRHAELPESWRLRIGVPILIFGVYVDCPKETIVARARHAARELGESLDDRPSNEAIRRIMDEYLAKMLNVPVWSESEKSLLDIFFRDHVWLPPRHVEGGELSNTRFYGICVNQMDVKNRNELFTKPENTLLFVKPLEKA
ncbi:hypothetical protein FKP32DRAFT_1587410 [Trametes sanguinea]|nr:hypothetical protein FKP32DRAFT_1587410 [Trametes sanguinea]